MQLSLKIVVLYSLSYIFFGFVAGFVVVGAVAAVVIVVAAVVLFCMETCHIKVH